MGITLPGMAGSVFRKSKSLAGLWQVVCIPGRIRQPPPIFVYFILVYLILVEHPQLSVLLEQVSGNCVHILMWELELRGGGEEEIAVWQHLIPVPSFIPPCQPEIPPFPSPCKRGSSLEVL